MKKFFLSLAVFVMALCANAQTNQYFWYNGNLMMGNPIAQIDSVTFGDEDTDSILIYLPRTIIKTIEVHDTMYVTVHDTIKAYSEEDKTMYKGHEYVDLGLPSGLLWATCNVGANAPEQIGGYYSWGETQTKTNYTLDDYLYKNNPITLSDISGTQYDAATANWGAEWRMPTKQECNELISNCTIKDTTINNVIGKLVIGANNNRIFIPGSGYHAEKLYYCQAESFWTSTACGSSYAYRMWEWSYISFSEREYGFQIRPVVSATADVISQTETIPGAQIVHDTVYITIHDTVCPNDVPEGALNGLFSVSADKKVRFSKGNLQYQPSTDSWRFAENQYDITGYTGYFNNTQNDEWIELFGWGTGDNPLKNDNNPGNYSNFVDWGTNFLEVTNNRSWRTLSILEWEFLINERENHASLCAKAIVEGVNGLIVFPDDFHNINTLEIQYGTIHPFSVNTFNSNQWKILEQKGAVFLPAAGWADNDYYQSPGIYEVNIGGCYWSSTPYSNTIGYSLNFDDNGCGWHPNLGDQKSDKHSVRLVQDVE